MGKEGRQETERNGKGAADVNEQAANVGFERALWESGGCGGLWLWFTRQKCLMCDDRHGII